MTDKEIDMENIFNIQKAEEYNKNADFIKGIILTTTVRLEYFISIMLNNLFCKNELKNEFHKYFLSDTLTFEQKKSIFCSMRKTKNFKLEYEYKEIGADLQKIQDLRNLVAHSDTYMNPELVNNFEGKEIELISFTKKYGERIIKISMGENNSEDINNNIYSVNLFVERINRFIKFAEKNIS